MILKLPKFEETMDSATITEYLIEVGDTVKKGDELYEVETEKFTREVESPVDGTVVRFIVEEGEEIDVGDPVLEIRTSDVNETGENEKTNAIVNTSSNFTDMNINSVNHNHLGGNKSYSNKDSEDTIKIVPAARLLARENNIELEDLKSFAKNNVITIQDVKVYLQEKARK